MFKCAQCPEKGFQFEKQVKLHYYACHKVLDEALHCDECGKKFENQFKLSDHKKVHGKV